MTTAYIGDWLEWTGSTSTMNRYYYAGGARVAMRVGSTTLYYLLGDHPSTALRTSLGSISVIANPSGGMVGMQYYEAWGRRVTPAGCGRQPTSSPARGTSSPWAAGRKAG